MAEKVKKSKKANPMFDGAEEPKVEDTKVEGGEVKTGENGAEVKIATPEIPKAEKEAMPTNKPLVEKVVMPSAKKGSAVPSNASAGLLADQRKMKVHLESEEKYAVMIPLEPGEKQGTLKDFWLNGLHVQVPKGIMVKVPLGIYKVIEDNLNLTSQAGADMLVHRDAKTEEALS